MRHCSRRKTHQVLCFRSKFYVNLKSIHPVYGILCVFQDRLSTKHTLFLICYTFFRAGYLVMTRIKDCFERLKQESRTGLIPYITAGDPSPEATVDLLHTLVKTGADLLELGVPFSDPVADGPVIEKAHHRAVAQGVTLKGVLNIIQSFRKTDRATPVILMSYLNPVEMMGYENFAAEAGKAGADGLLTVDCPPEESLELCHALKKHHIDTIYLISPNTPDARIEKICRVSSGYLYYVSLKGVTGTLDLSVAEVKARIAHIKQFTSLPISAGFGISDGKTASAVSEAADAVVVGTALVKTLTDNSAETGYAALREQMQELRSAINIKSAEKS